MRCAEAAIAAIAASLCACVPAAIAQPFGLGRGTLQGPASVSRASHVLTLRRAGGEVRLLEGGRVVHRLSPAPAGPVVLDGTPGNDTLRVDFGGGNPVPGGLIFDGGADAGGRGDGLELVGGRFARTHLTFERDRPGHGHDGTVVLDGTKIVFRDLEPLALTGTSADLVVTVPQGDGDNQTVLENDAGNQASMSQLRSGAGTFETTTFTHPTNSLTFNLGNDPTESLTVNDDSVGRRIAVNGGSGANVLSATARRSKAGSSTAPAGSTASPTRRTRRRWSPTSVRTPA